MFENKDGEYICKCGRVFNKSQSYYGHLGHCKAYLGRDPIDRFKDKRSWSKGLTKETNESIKKISESNSKRLRDLKENNPLVKWNKNKPKTSYINQSNTRKENYKLGILKPAPGVGRGKYSYLLYSGNRILLRSTYEFIYALYLLYNNVEFEYESVRATYKNKTYVSDFLIDKKVVEVKGNYNFNFKNKKEAFELLGYEFEIVFYDKIELCLEFLRKKIDIDGIIKDIYYHHDVKHEYLEYKFS